MSIKAEQVKSELSSEAARWALDYNQTCVSVAVSLAHILGLPLPSAGFTHSEVTVADNEVRPAPSHHHTAVTLAVSGRRAGR